jgi:hypothetical protein
MFFFTHMCPINDIDKCSASVYNNTDVGLYVQSHHTGHAVSISGWSTIQLMYLNAKIY